MNGRGCWKVPRCPKGHEQKLGLNCSACGARLSYSDACRDLLKLPQVQPDFGKVAALFVGLPPAAAAASFAGAVTAGDSGKQAGSEFTVERVQGGSWLDFYTRNVEALTRWLRLQAFGKSQCKFVVVDARDPLSVLAIASVPLAAQTVVVAVTADNESTPIEQNTSYVAVSVALERGFPVLAFPNSFVGDLFIRAEGDAYVARKEALSRIVGSLLEHADDLTDFTERDLHLGVQTHYVYALMSGSKRIYGEAANAFTVQSYQLPDEVKPGDVKTLYFIVSGAGDLKEDFERSFVQFRSRSYREALSAECRFHERDGSPFFDLLTIYGVAEPLVLQASQAGYNTVAKRVQTLKVGSVA